MLTRFTRNPIIKFGDDGQRVGFNMVGPGGYWADWGEFFHSYTRPGKNLVTPAELGKAFGEIWLHNPFGHDWGGMRWNQLQILRTKAADKPLDARLQIVSDVSHFRRAILDAPYRKTAYIGYPRSVMRLEGETELKWVNRCFNEAAIYRECFDRVLVDSTIGVGHAKTNAWVAENMEFYDRAEYMLIKRMHKHLKDAGKELGHEPWKNKGKENDYLRPLSTVITEKLYKSLAGKWQRLNRYEPGELGEPVYYIIRLDTSLTFAQKIDYVNREQESHPNFTMVIDYGGIQDARILEVAA